MAGIVEPIVVNQIADEFLLITAPWKQQNMYINELLSKQHEIYKEADVSSENAHLLAIEMLETISFAIPHYQKDIAQERDIFSQTDVNNLQVKYNELREIENLFENWTRDTYPKIVEQFMESAAHLKIDTEEQLRMRLDSGKQGDILDPLISALEAHSQGSRAVLQLLGVPKPLTRVLVNSQGSRASLESVAQGLQADCKEKCEVISREILDVYLEEFNSIISDMFEKIKTSLDVEFAALSHDKAPNAPNESSISPFVSVRHYDGNYYGDNLWFNAFKKMTPVPVAIALGSVIGLKAIIAGGWAAVAVVGIVSATGVGLIIAGVGATTVAISRFLKRKNPHREIQNGLVSYVEQFRDETIRNFSKFHKDGVENTESLLKSVLEEMRTKQARGFSAISEATNISEEQKEQKVAVLDATSKQLQKLSRTIKECLRKGGN